MMPPAPDPRLGSHCRPLVLGAGIGHAAGAGGSLGGFVLLGDGKPALLATAFAISPPDAAPGDFIHQPGTLDQPTLTGASRVARLTRIVAAKPDRLETVDAAVAVLADGVGFLGNVIPSGFPNSGRALTAPIGTSQVTAGDPVAMIGRSSGLVGGGVAGVDISMRMSVSTPRRKSLHYDFTGLLAVTRSDGPFSLAGDGGALVWHATTGAALGLLLGGDEGGVSFIVPLAPILAALQVTWVDPSIIRN